MVSSSLYSRAGKLRDPGDWAERYRDARGKQTNLLPSDLVSPCHAEGQGHQIQDTSETSRQYAFTIQQLTLPA